MAVSVRGRVHKLRVCPGPEGKEDFKRQVRQLLGYSDDMEFDVIFECKTPHSGENITKLRLTAEHKHQANLAGKNPLCMTLHISRVPCVHNTKHCVAA